MRKKKFVVTVFDPKYETLIVPVALLNSTLFTDANVHPSYRPQLISKKALTIFLAITILMTTIVTIVILVLKASTVTIAMKRGFD